MKKVLSVIALLALLFVSCEKKSPVDRLYLFIAFKLSRWVQQSPICSMTMRAEKLLSFL